MTVGRPLEYDPDQALQSAMLLFWRKGYEATSMRDLLNTMDLSRSSFYQAYGSKQALFKQCLQRYSDQLKHELEFNLKAAVDGREFITRLFHAVAEEARINERRGCLLMNTANEFAQSDEKIAKLVSSSLDSLVNVFQDAIEAAQSQGEVSGNKSAQHLAHYLVSSMSGMKSMVKAGVDKATLTLIADSVLTALD